MENPKDLAGSVEDPHLPTIQKYWPTNTSGFWEDKSAPGQQKNAIALTLLGLDMYRAAYYWRCYAVKMVEQPFNSDNYPRKNEVYAWDKRMKETLGSLNKEQKKALSDLLEHVCDGVGHSILSAIDQPVIGGVCRISSDNQHGRTCILDPTPYDLHELWFRWKDLHGELSKNSES